MVKLVTMKASSEARQRADKLIRDVRKHPKIKGHYKFFVRPIGSQTRRCIVQDANGKYDLDFQIVLTKNSKVDESETTRIKTDFLRAFTDSANVNEKVEDSTTVVTVRCSKNSDKFIADKEKFSFDFVIISSGEDKRIRRNGQNQYTWVELPSKNSYIYEKFKKMDAYKQRDMLENDLLLKIIKEKAKPEDKRVATIDLFYQAVNNYNNKKVKQ